MTNNKQDIIDKLISLVQIEGEHLSKSNSSTREKLEKVDVLLDTIRFLAAYDENIKVLNDYWLNKRKKEKFRE